MKNLFLFSFLFLFSTLDAQMHQRRIDSFMTAASNFENDRLFPKAQAVYNMLEPILTADDKYYGDVLEKIFYYNLEKNQTDRIVEYYKKIVNSKLDDRDIVTNKINEPYRNYRYKATKALAEYYYKKRMLQKCIEYIDLADYSMTYQTTLLSNFKAEKIDLAYSRSKVYDELTHKDSAFMVLFKRAIEYDYDMQLKNYTSNHRSSDEKELTVKIFSFYPTIKDISTLKKMIDNAFNNCEHKNDGDGTSRIKFTLEEITYIITVNSSLDSKEDCLSFLRNSPFYIELSKKTGGQGK
jgi:hypothetical protein